MSVAILLEGTMGPVGGRVGRHDGGHLVEYRAALEDSELNIFMARS